ncbi:DUF4214 domain-containing protein [Sulfitobacter sp. Ks41]|uniref:DUF4214 domain-containing protein n=1 Tax=Sulfitobacter sp. Ks41 TaxID=2731139 RepID=UPI0023E1CD34|nr:DUF4214 domain-containing protein [Sulfitobacter sp. Ks41]MDF3362901.1 DUF4214 domain-containing protein [Sulfitobacter sp. Ks41]
MATQEQKQALTALYVGYYDRAPDPDGLQFWIDQIDNGREFSTIAADFAAAPEALAKYPYLSTPDVSTPSTFITSIYLNLFGRTPDQAGLDFWTGVLNDGSVSVAEMIEEIIMGAVNDEDAGTFDKTVLDNKIEVGLDFAESTADVSGFEFDADAKMAAEAAVNGVTEDPATVEAAKAATDAYLAGETNQGDTLTLTAGEDNLVGTAMNDVFTAPLVASTFGLQVKTLNSTDTLDGGEGVDRLNVTLNDDAGGFGPSDTSNPLISNVEQFFVRAASASDLNMTGVSGAEQLWNDRSVSTLGYNNVQNGVVIGLNGVRGDTEVEYDSGVLGTEFTQTVVAQGAGTATNQVDVDVAVDGGDTLTGLNLNAAAGMNNINLTGDIVDITDLTISGDAALMLESDGEFSSIGTVDATAYAGDLELDISGQEDGADLNVALGAGADSLAVDVDTLDDEDNLATLDGGEGEDNLTLNGFSSAAQISALDFANVSGFEQLTLNFPTIDVQDNTLDLSETEFTSLVVDGGISGTTGGTFTVIGSEDFNAITVNEAVSAGVFTYEGFETLELNLNADTTATNIVGDELVNATLNLGVVDDGDDIVTANIQELNAALLETLTVNLGEDGVLTGPSAGSAASLETITVTGGDESSATYTFGGEEESLATIDMTDMSGMTTLTFVDDVDADLSFLIGNGDLTYTGGDADEDDRETFAFTGDEIGTINIDGFTSGVGSNGDRIDFSAFEAVSGLNNLEIVYTDDLNGDGTADGTPADEGTLITAADGEFDGSIAIQGTDLSTDAFNFIF